MEFYEQTETQPVLPASEEQQEERRANLAISSWGIEKFKKSKNGAKLNSTIDLKEFLHQRGDNELSGLHRAAREGATRTIMNIMKKEGADGLRALDMLDSNGCTPLMYAAMTDGVSVIEMLLHFSAYRETVDQGGHTAVHYAAFFGKAKALQFLIEAAADWNSRDIFGRTPLHWSAANKNEKGLLFLLHHTNRVYGDVNQRDSEGMTPLHCAAQYEKPKNIELLARANCDSKAVDIEGKTALHWTAENIDPTCIQVLTDCFPSLLNTPDSYGQSILHIAAMKGNTALVYALLNIQGIDIDARDNNECTALHLASIGGHTPVTSLLVEAKALDSCIDIQGFTALHYAVQSDSPLCVKVLVTSGYTTHVASANDLSVTPLMMAAENGLHNCIKALLSNKDISLNEQDPDGKSALHFACQANSEDCVDLLLEHGANPNLPDKTDTTPLGIAVQEGYHTCIKRLISSDAKFDHMDGDGHLYIHKAVLLGHVDAVSTLLSIEGMAHVQDRGGDTPLELATYAGVEETVLLLLQKEADPNNMNFAGLTPMHIAAMEGRVGCLRALLENGGYPNSMDRTENRYTPIDYAVASGHTVCVELLQEWGAISLDAIKHIAAINIQTHYRCHLAKRKLEELKQHTRAILVLQRFTRGLLQRVKYRRLKQEHYAAIKIQSFIKGAVQRLKFKVRLQQHRYDSTRRQVVEEFGRAVLACRGPALVVDTSVVVRTRSDSEQEEWQQKEYKHKTELALQMRAMIAEQEDSFREFLVAERQRREEKARQQKIATMTDIIIESRARRTFTQEHFKYTCTVRTCDHAARTIQQFYRDYKIRRDAAARERERAESLQRLKEIQCARTIQRAWRRYFKWCKFQSKYLQSIYTNPTVVTHHHSNRLAPIAIPSYERRTLTSGGGRRKVHKTQSSGFHIFKPILPSGSGSRPSTYNRPRTDTMASPRSHALDTPRIKRMQKMWPWVHHILKDTPPETPKNERRKQNGSFPPLKFHSVSSSNVSPVAMPTMKLQSVMEEVQEVSP